MSIIKRLIFPITGSLPVFRLNTRTSVHKYFSSSSLIKEQLSSPDTPKTNGSLKKPHFSQYYFNTYKVVEDLERQGFTRGQAESIMRGMESLLVESFKIRSKLFSKAELENEAYLFQSSLSDFHTEMQMMRRNNLVDLNSENSLIQREVASIQQQLQVDIGKMRHFIQLDINNYKADIREEQKKMEINIQEIDNEFTVTSGDIRTDIEALKWETTRMALMGIFGSAVFALLVMFVTSNKKSNEISSEVSVSKNDNPSNGSNTSEMLS